VHLKIAAHRASRAFSGGRFGNTFFAWAGVAAEITHQLVAKPVICSMIGLYALERARLARET
jgi:hypothetical protein